MLVDDFLPAYDVSDSVALVVAADVQRTWGALMQVDLIEVGRKRPMVVMLGALRALPEIVSHSLSVRALADNRTLLSGTMRTATTDEHARRWFRRYWTLGVGSGAHVLVHGLLEVTRDIAEHPS